MLLDQGGYCYATRIQPRKTRERPEITSHGVSPEQRREQQDLPVFFFSARLVCSAYMFTAQSARKNALQVIAEYEGTPAEAVEVPDLSALRQLYSEKNPAVPSLRWGGGLCYDRAAKPRAERSQGLRTDTSYTLSEKKSVMLSTPLRSATSLFGPN